MLRLKSAFVLFACAALVAVAGQPSARADAPPPRAKWAFESSDVPLDPGYHFGRLANGLRYIVRPNANPAGTVLVRLQVDAGSLDERDDQRGYAHFVEHMAFQGSAHVPVGEMVRLLERKGLAFGADTNAATGFENTTYALDLPRNDADLLDTALMLMRETASELRFDAVALARERGVVLAEKRDRNSWQYREWLEGAGFGNAGARYVQRMPIGTEEALNAATSARLREFWAGHYVPAKTTVIVIGDIDADKAEAAITAHFADWRADPAPPQPDAGPVNFADKARSDIYLDLALSPRITAFRQGPWQPEPDSIAVRQDQLLRRIGYAIINRRLEHRARAGEPPFRDASFGSADIFRAERTTALAADCIDAKWQTCLTEAALEYRRALAFGFTAAEVAEQVANLRSAAAHEAAAAGTRANGALLNDVVALLHDDRVPADPTAQLAWFAAYVPQITPAAVMAAMNREAVALDQPLLRYQGPAALPGGAAALRAVWDAAMRAPLANIASAAAGQFGYSDFGPAGRVESDAREPLLGIRTLRFANGVRLNLKHTDLEHDRIHVSVLIDGGDMLATKANPLAVAMVPFLALGGLGKHSADDLQSLLAGHSVGTGIADTPETFAEGAVTTPQDLSLQLAVSAAQISDPGYAREGELQFGQAVIGQFAAMRATPAAALGAAIGGVLANGDPRFTLQPQAAYRALTFARLKGDIADRLAHGAIEIALVGDIDEDRAIAAVARTFGALPAREAEFRAYADQHRRPFTADHTTRVVRHQGPGDQALIQTVWRSRDDSDPVAKQQLNLLSRVVQIELTENLRQRLGKAYSPGAFSDPSRVWTDYGTFTVTASINIADLAATRTAIAETIAGLRNHPVSADILQRARAPLAENFDNALKTNSGWMAIAARAQSQPQYITRQLQAKARLLALSAADVQTAALRYLTPTGGIEVLVLPESAAAPAGTRAAL